MKVKSDCRKASASGSTLKVDAKIDADTIVFTYGGAPCGIAAANITTTATKTLAAKGIQVTETPDIVAAMKASKHTTAEIERRNAPDGTWQTRVIKNKFPALDELAKPDHGGDFFHTRINGFGVHEVVVDSPRHDATITRLSLPDIETILYTYRSRYRALELDERVKHIIIFKNNGDKAGSSLIHPHSQIIATPIVSGQVDARISTTREYRKASGRCLICDMVRSEIESNRRIVDKNEHFASFLPYAALSSYHTWVFPLRHNAHFGRIEDEEITALAQILRNVIRGHERLLNYPDYNFVVRSAPVGCANDDYHWYISIIPRLSKTAGFEIGSNIYINGTLPETGALNLRNIIDVLKDDM